VGRVALDFLRSRCKWVPGKFLGARERSFLSKVKEQKEVKKGKEEKEPLDHMVPEESSPKESPSFLMIAGR